MLLDLLSLGGPAASPSSTTVVPPLAGLMDVDPFAKSSLGDLDLTGGQPPLASPVAVDPFASLATPSTSALPIASTSSSPPAIGRHHFYPDVL